MLKNNENENKNKNEKNGKHTREVNFDGLVGPTHHYAGLAFGNLASTENAFKVSNPKAAALQGLNKMHLLMQLGLPQAVLPPHERPFLPLFKNLGFRGSGVDILKKVYQYSPKLFSAAYSASSMWAANAGTVTPSADSKDSRVHLTPANLISHLHRALEADFTYTVFKKIFNSKQHFVVHKPLFPHLHFADEGAANHNRFCLSYGEKGLEVFVYGRDFSNKETSRYPARQTLQASEAIARLHRLDLNTVLFLKQNPVVIEQGVFHNDVISVANQNVFLYHEEAFQLSESFKSSDFSESSEAPINALRLFQEKSAFLLIFIPVSSAELTIKEAVETYLFNSQLITLANGSMALIAPIESQENKRALSVLSRIISEENHIQHLHFVDCRQSMFNGGGPACLRLRVVLTESEQKACHPEVFLTEALYNSLTQWVEKHYRDRLTHADLLDPHLLQESYLALDELTQILNLKSLYNFQKI